MATTKVAQQAMTAEEARSFDRFSVMNAAEVIKNRPCGCAPYEDVFTFKRWVALGMVVRKGEKAIKIPVIIKRDEDENGKARTLCRTTAVFCRHQVKPLTEPSPERKRQLDTEQAALDREHAEIMGPPELPTIRVDSSGVLYTEIEQPHTVKRIDLDGNEHDTFITENERDEAQAPLF